MEQAWQLQEAKSKFSELVEKALEQGPQVITRRGIKTAVIISYEDYLKLKKRPEKPSAVFLRAPKADFDLDQDQN